MAPRSGCSFGRRTGRSSGRRTGRRTGRRSTGRMRRQTEVVILRFNPLTNRVIAASISGIAFPCTALLVPGARATFAIQCLLASGFVLISDKRIGNRFIFTFARD